MSKLRSAVLCTDKVIASNGLLAIFDKIMLFVSFYVLINIRTTLLPYRLSFCNTCSMFLFLIWTYHCNQTLKAHISFVVVKHGSCQNPMQLLILHVTVLNSSSTYFFSTFYNDIYWSGAMLQWAMEVKCVLLWDVIAERGGGSWHLTEWVT